MMFLILLRASVTPWFIDIHLGEGEFFFEDRRGELPSILLGEAATGGGDAIPHDLGLHLLGEVQDHGDIAEHVFDLLGGLGGVGNLGGVGRGHGFIPVLGIRLRTKGDKAASVPIGQGIRTERKRGWFFREKCSLATWAAPRRIVVTVALEGFRTIRKLLFGRGYKRRGTIPFHNSPNSLIPRRSAIFKTHPLRVHKLFLFASCAPTEMP